MSVEQLRPVIRSIIESQSIDKATSLIIRVVQDELGTGETSVQTKAPRPLAPDDWYSADEVAVHLGIGRESARKLVTREPAFESKEIPRTGKGPSKMRVYSGRAIIQHRDRNGRVTPVTVRAEG